MTRKGEFDGVKALDDPKLKDHEIGLIAGTPPSDRLGALGLTPHVRSYVPYAFGTDRTHQTVAAEVVADIAAKKLDAAVLWGPSAGWLARQSGVAMDVVPLLSEPDRPPLSFRVSMGVRLNENDWKRTLNTVLRKRRADIERVLRDYAVPLLDEDQDKPLDSAQE